MESEDKLSEELNRALSRANGLYERWFQETGLNGCLAQTLYALYREPGLSQKEISQRYMMPRQTVNNVIKALEREGYIALLPDPKDGRGRLIAFTPSGKAYAEQTLKPLLALDREVIGRVGQRKLRQLIEALQAYGDALAASVEQSEEKQEE